MEDEVKTEQEEAPKPKRQRRSKKAEVKEQITKECIVIGEDAAATIYCKYSDREKMATRLYEEHGTAGKGLMLKCDKCGTSIEYQAPDRVPTMNTQCGSKLHMLIRWISLD